MAAAVPAAMSAEVAVKGAVSYPGGAQEMRGNGGWRTGEVK